MALQLKLTSIDYDGSIGREWTFAVSANGTATNFNTTLIPGAANTLNKMLMLAEAQGQGMMDVLIDVDATERDKVYSDEGEKKKTISIDTRLTNIEQRFSFKLKVDEYRGPKTESKDSAELTFNLVALIEGPPRIRLITPEEGFSFLVNGERYTYQFEVTGSSDQLKTRIEAMIDQKYLEQTVTISPVSISNPSQLVNLELIIRTSVSEEPGTTFPVLLKNDADGMVLDKVDVPLVILRVPLALHILDFDPVAAIIGLDNMIEPYSFNVEVSALETVEIKTTISASPESSGIVSEPADVVKIFDTAKEIFGFDIKSPTPLPLGTTTITATATVPVTDGRLTASESRELLVIQKIAIMPDAQSVVLQYSGTAGFNINASRSRPFAAESLPIGITLRDENGISFDLGEIFESHPDATGEIPFAVQYYDGSLKVEFKAKSSVEVAYFKGTIVISCPKGMADFYEINSEAERTIAVQIGSK